MVFCQSSIEYYIGMLWVRSTYLGLYIIQDLKNGDKNCSHHNYIANGDRMVLYCVVSNTIKCFQTTSILNVFSNTYVKIIFSIFSSEFYLLVINIYFVLVLTFPLSWMIYCVYLFISVSAKFEHL